MARLFLLVAALLLGNPFWTHAAELGPALRQALQGRTGELPVIVRLQAQADTTGLAPGGDRRQGRSALIRRLRQVARDSQAPLQSFLVTRGVARVDSLVLINALALRAAPGLIAELAARPEVARIELDGSVPTPRVPAPGVVTAAVTPSAVIPWNLSTINAPTLWGQGIDGTGVVVATLDTGVDIASSGLAASYRGGGNSWFDPYGHTTVPSDFLTDNIYHGTAVMGLLVGAATGVAPGARWIAARIFPPTGTATYSAIHLAFDWVLDPDGNPATDDAPDVVNNSWSLDPGTTSAINICNHRIPDRRPAPARRRHRGGLRRRECRCRRGAVDQPQPRQQRRQPWRGDGRQQSGPRPGEQRRTLPLRPGGDGLPRPGGAGCQPHQHGAGRHHSRSDRDLFLRPPRRRSSRPAPAGGAAGGRQRPGAGGDRVGAVTGSRHGRTGQLLRQRHARRGQRPEQPQAWSIGPPLRPCRWRPPMAPRG